MKYELAENIKRLRLEKHLTQKQLGERLGVGTSIICGYESQDRLPSIKMLVKLAAEFNVTIEYLLGINKNKTIDVSDLTSEQVLVLNSVIEQFKGVNKKQGNIF